MKKSLIILSLIVSYGNIGNCQLSNTPPIEIKDIEAGFINIDHLRAVLIERGFKFSQKEGEEPYVEGWVGDSGHPYEMWHLLDPNKYPDEFMPRQLVIFSFLMNFYPNAKVIRVQIFKDRYPVYADIFLYNVQKSFPEKKTEPKYAYKDNQLVEDGYFLVYYRKDSKINVDFDIDEDNHYNFDFEFVK